MKPMIDTDTLDRLLARGRAAGHLTIQDLAEALPVDAMGADEIALVVAYLEERGVSVELDEALRRPGPSSAHPSPARPELVLPAEEPSAVPTRPPVPLMPGAPAEPSAADRPRGYKSVHAAVVLAGVLVLVLLAIGIMALAR